jgi:hypothetical protein
MPDAVRGPRATKVHPCPPFGFIPNPSHVHHAVRLFNALPSSECRCAALRRRTVQELSGTHPTLIHVRASCGAFFQRIAQQRVPWEQTRCAALRRRTVQELSGTHPTLIHVEACPIQTQIPPSEQRQAW